MNVIANYKQKETMKKTLKVKIERWILAELAQPESPLSCYDLLRRSADIMPNDLNTCLDHLAGTGEITRLKSTPNPTFQLPSQ
jgi:hypothetical protein